MPKKVTSVSSLFNLLKIVFALLFSLNAKADYEDGVNAAFAGDFETAFREFSRAAEAGLDLAQYNLAILYFTGQGVEQDYAQASHWLGKASAGGDTQAPRYLRIVEQFYKPDATTTGTP